METTWHLRSRKTTSSVASMRPHVEETHDSTADVSRSLSLPILSSQVTSSEAMRMLASQENVSDAELLGVALADTMLIELSTEVIAHKPAQQQQPPNPSLPLASWV